MRIVLAQYASYGGRKAGGDDDIAGSLPQFPGRESFPPQQIDVTTGSTIDLNKHTVFVEFQAYDGDADFNYDDAGHSSISDVNANRITPGQIRFQGVVAGKSGEQFINKVNFKEPA